MFADFKEKASVFGKKNSRLAESSFFLLFQLLVAFTVVLVKGEVVGAILFAFTLILQLVLCESILPPVYTLLLMSVFLTRCYDSYDVFIGYTWVAIPFLIAVAFHFIVYSKPIKIGATFFGVCAVAVAVTFGGIGSISLSEYTNPTSLYYILMLGGGMIIAYLLISSQIDKDIKNAKIFSKMLLLMGVLACFCVLSFYLFEFKTVIFMRELIRFQSSNNLATFIMISLPITFGYAKNGKLWLVLSLPFYFCLILTGSRGALLMGTAELFICLIWYLIVDKNHRKFNIGVIAFVVLILTLFYFKWESFYEFYFSKNADDAFLNGLILKNEARVKLLKYALSDFRSNIFFGRGLGYSGNTDAYNPVKGALYWYHMWGPQIIGSMGIIGVLAFGYQLVNRIAVAFNRQGQYTGMLFMSYVGLFLMSQVNPGEFCPIPYSLIAVIIFVIIEKTGKLKNGKTTYCK